VEITNDHETPLYLKLIYLRQM